MNPIKIVNRHHKPHNLTEGPITYIGRGSPLGNPYKITNEQPRAVVISKYDEWLEDKMVAGDGPVLAELQRLAEASIAGPIQLECYCAPHMCHGEIIKTTIIKAINEFKDEG